MWRIEGNSLTTYNALEPLRNTTHDVDPLVADAAKRAVNLHDQIVPEEDKVSYPSRNDEPHASSTPSPNSPEYFTQRIRKQEFSNSMKLGITGDVGSLAMAEGQLLIAHILVEILEEIKSDSKTI